MKSGGFFGDKRKIAVKTDNTPKHSCLKTIIAKILKSLIINNYFES